MIDFMHKAAKVTDDIMTCFAIGLGLPEDFYKEVPLFILHALSCCRSRMNLFRCASVTISLSGMFGNGVCRMCRCGMLATCSSLSCHACSLEPRQLMRVPHGVGLLYEHGFVFHTLEVHQSICKPGMALNCLRVLVMIYIHCY